MVDLARYRSQHLRSILPRSLDQLLLPRFLRRKSLLSLSIVESRHFIGRKVCQRRVNKGFSVIYLIFITVLDCCCGFRFFKEMLCVLLTATLSFPLGVVQFIGLYHGLHDSCSIHTEVQCPVQPRNLTLT